METYSETLLSILRYFLRVIIKVTYVGLVHYGFVTVRRNYSHLILEHVINNTHITYFITMKTFVNMTIRNR